MPSLLEAIDRKYGKDEHLFNDLPIAIYVPRKGPRNCIPSLLVLNDCDIESAGDDQELERKCHAVEELDLAQNKLSEWREVFGILRHMPRVRFVNLSFNNLTERLSCIELSSGYFRHLRDLILNATYVNWKSLENLLKILPNLQELHLSMNGYEKIELDDIQHHGIKKLHFTGNPVRTWSEVCKLGIVFPHLESLVLADCPLQSLEPNGYDNAHFCFPSLRCLNVNNTHLSNWSDVDRLRKFPLLHCLRIQSCPLVEEYTEHERRLLLIARLPNVKTLNGGGVIDGEEREDSERAFIRFYMEKPEKERPERYYELVAIHGQLDPLVSVDLSPEKKVNVIVTFDDKHEHHSFSVYQTVQELKQKLEVITGIPANKMRLFYLDQIMHQIQGPEEMKFPQKQLYSYNIASGDELIVDSK